MLFLLIYLHALWLFFFIKKRSQTNQERRGNPKGKLWPGEYLTSQNPEINTQSKKEKGYFKKDLYFSIPL